MLKGIDKWIYTRDKASLRGSDNGFFHGSETCFILTRKWGILRLAETRE
jgi:hypothetical protein